MRRVGLALATLAVIAAATWAYHVNYLTKQALDRVDRLHREIAAEREAVEVLRIEWSYLNAPERLARLVELANDQLGLVPAVPASFGDIERIPFPPPPAPSPDTGAPAPGAAPETPPSAEEAPALLALGDVSTRPVITRSVAPLPPPRPASWRPQ